MEAWSEFYLGARRVNGVCGFVNRLLERSLPMLPGRVRVLIEGEAVELPILSILDLAIQQWREQVLLPNASLALDLFREALQSGTDLTALIEPWVVCGEHAALYSLLGHALLEYWQPQVETQLRVLSATEYIQWARAQLAQEQGRLSTLLPAGETILAQLRGCLILEPLSRLPSHTLSEGTVGSLYAIARDDVMAKEAICQAFRAMVCHRVMAAMAKIDAKSTKESITVMVASFRQDLTLINHQGAAVFAEALLQGWREGLATVGVDLAQLLPPLWDHGALGMELLPLVRDPEVLLETAWRLLAKRMLSGMVDPKYEEALLTCLWRGCRVGEVGLRMRRMLQDGEQSVLLKERIALPTLEPLIVAWGTWPIKALSCSTLPPQMIGLQKQWEEAYAELYPQRKLTWLPHLSRVTLSLTGDRTYELQMTQPMAMALLWIQTSEPTSYSSLASHMQLPPRDVKKLIKGFLQIGLLSVEGDLLSINPHFHHERSRLKILPKDFPLISGMNQEPVDQEGEGEAPTVSIEERKYALQAMLVRVLKREKEISPERLLQMASLEGGFTAHLVKEALEKLSEKGFVDLDKRRNLYLYLP